MSLKGFFRLLTNAAFTGMNGRNAGMNKAKHARNSRCSGFLPAVSDSARVRPGKPFSKSIEFGRSQRLLAAQVIPLLLIRNNTLPLRAHPH